MDEKLLRYRTLQTIMLTAVILLSYLAKWLDGFGTFVSICMIIIYLIAGILLMKALFDLRRSISSDSDSNNTDTDLETEEIKIRVSLSAAPLFFI